MRAGSDHRPPPRHSATEVRSVPRGSAGAGGFCGRMASGQHSTDALGGTSDSLASAFARGICRAASTLDGHAAVDPPPHGGGRSRGGSGPGKLRWGNWMGTSRRRVEVRLPAAASLPGHGLAVPLPRNCSGRPPPFTGRGGVPRSDASLARRRGPVKTVTWLILPVVICLSQRLSHACLSISNYTVKLRMAH